MTLDDLAKKATIEFVSPLNFKETMRLLKQIAQDPEIDTSYIGSFRGSLIPVSMGMGGDSPRDIRQCYELKGIFRVKDERAHLGYKSSIAEFLNHPPGKYRTKRTFSKVREEFYGIRFLAPKLTDSDFVERIRRKIKEYFAEH